MLWLFVSLYSSIRAFLFLVSSFIINNVIDGILCYIKYSHPCRKVWQQWKRQSTVPDSSLLTFASSLLYLDVESWWWSKSSWFFFYAASSLVEFCTWHSFKLQMNTASLQVVMNSDESMGMERKGFALWITTEVKVGLLRGFRMFYKV